MKRGSWRDPAGLEPPLPCHTRRGLRPCRDARADVGFARLFRVLCTDAILEIFGPRQPREHYREFLGEERRRDTRALCGMAARAMGSDPQGLTPSARPAEPRERRRYHEG